MLKLSTMEAKPFCIASSVIEVLGKDAEWSLPPSADVDPPGKIAILYGFEAGERILVDDFVIFDDETLVDRLAFEKSIIQLSSHKPGGSSPIGILVRASGAGVEEQVAALTDSFFPELSDFFISRVIYLVVVGREELPTIGGAGDGLHKRLVAHLYWGSEQAKEIDVTVVPTSAQHYQSKVPFRIRSQHQLIVQEASTSDGLLRRLDEAFAALSERILAQSTYFSFGSDYIVGNEGEEPVCLARGKRKMPPTVAQFASRLGFSTSDAAPAIFDEKKWLGATPYTGGSAFGNIDRAGTSPLITLPRKSVISIPLELDALALVAPDAPIASLPAYLLEALSRTLSCTEVAMKRQASDDDDATLRPPEICHVALPTPLSRLLNIVSPVDEETRERLVNAFHLPKTRGRYWLDRAASLQRWQSLFSAQRLLSPHESVPKLDDANFIVRSVSGHYTYHHYLQDRFNDRGWGCAYRSLQTLCSWLALNGHIDADISEQIPPAHRRVQQVLVDIGDKPASLVGSREWIGSMEVGFYLDTALKVPSRTIHVSSGDEMPTVARQLLYHFEKEASPVMIGGDLYAYTILGVAFRESDGECKWLILDPHFASANDDELDMVIRKGWCGWKDSEFWKKTFYNLCLPVPSSRRHV